MKTLRSNRIVSAVVKLLYMGSIYIAWDFGVKWMLVVIGFGVSMCMYLLHDIAYLLEYESREKRAEVSR